MKVDRDVDKVLDKSDAIITNAGYQQLEQKKQSPGEDDFIDASIVTDDYVEFNVSDTDDMGLPVGLREQPMG
ncbi:hypothetical protein SEA_FORZA_98 [Gordonia phage Forza]|uniref:Uncharacterized protein n=1 Tax=Gordonia phage Forza TaxID=2571247 RepID=A0A650F0K9_9CAUD|nr:hypothetical protein PP303_gp098 [Gordonia phage Forza]QEM41565.1 hypothetical protein SEA_BOOPY_98 [Gordonia phage Boopy]QGT55091.1 hypothetical protein SEA_FORZA_98 [Gordonia phage Forza]UXE04239.1 hypothetical protein SEA_BLUENGOLD_97 [Gordonia phage BlueNGold]WBF03879.1 hypothetical protein SEA_MAREELIH_96 [Gordonia phage Mareelih]